MPIQLMCLRATKQGLGKECAFKLAALFFSGMKTLLKKYEPPKLEVVNISKQRLERIHAEFASSSK